MKKIEFSKESLEIKRLVSDLNCMGTYGLVELELQALERRIAEQEEKIKMLENIIEK